jgi:hypothetical protein
MMAEDQTRHFLLLFNHNLINYSHTSIIALSLSLLLVSVFVGVYHIDHRQLHHLERLFRHAFFLSWTKGKLFILSFPDKNKRSIYIRSMFETIRRTFASSNSSHRMKSKYVLYLDLSRKKTKIFLMIKDQHKWLQQHQ